MSIYKNIDGTSKKSFKLGARGLELKTSTAVDPVSAKTINKLLVDGKAVVTEDHISISRACITQFIPGQNEFTLGYRYLDDNNKIVEGRVTVYTKEGTPVGGIGTGDVVGPDQSVEGNIAVFASDNGKTIDDSGFRVLSDILNTKDDEKEIPTFSAVKQYVEGKEQPLSLRRTGANAGHL